MTLLLVQGCMDWVEPSSFSQFTDFEQVAAPGPEMDMDKVVEAKIDTGPYRVVSGDVLDLTFPAVLSIETTQRLEIPNGMMTQSYRVSEQGTIALPVVGNIVVAGRTLADIENNVAEVYHATVAKERPPVFARINEYRTARVSIVGAVKQPGVYALRHDQMSLVTLVMEAGGISETGASIIRIVHQGDTDPASSVKDPLRESTQHPGLSRARLSDGRPGFRLNHPTHPRPAQVSLPPGFSMRFCPQEGCQIMGQLTVSLDDHVIASEWLDLSNEWERRVLTARLADMHHGLSAELMDQQLTQLPLLMKTDLNSQYAGTVGHGDQVQASTPSYGALGQENYTYPGLRPYQHDRITHAGLLASTVPDEGKRASSPQTGPTIVLPVKGLNIPFKDVTLQDGDRVTVEPLVMPIFTVLGLVNHQGNFEYPPGQSYNLMQAIAMAGGLDRVTDPKYAVVYRLTEDGRIVHTCYDISKSSHQGDVSPAPMSVLIRPGDIVDVAQTPRTRTNATLEQIFRVSIGVYVPLWDNTR